MPKNWNPTAGAAASGAEMRVARLADLLRWAAVKETSLQSILTLLHTESGAGKHGAAPRRARCGAGMKGARGARSGQQRGLAATALRGSW